MSAVGAHVSASPNEQTGRSAPLGTRAVVAMSGTFGYELDPNRLSDEEQEAIKEQIDRFTRYYDLIQNGDYYRLTPPGEKDFQAWQFVSADAKRTLVNVVLTRTHSNLAGIHFRLRGLDPEANYGVGEFRFDGCVGAPVLARLDAREHKDLEISGGSLMHAGFTLPRMFGDYPCAQILFERR